MATEATLETQEKWFGDRIAEELEQANPKTLRGRFTRDNQAATFRSITAVVAASLLQMLYELDSEQVRTIASLLVGKLGLPVGVVSGIVALFEFWRQDR